MDKDEIFDYVMETPQNTNPSILRDMLNRLDTSDGLPEVDESDNGKVLAVSSGAWSAQNPSGGLQLYGPYYFTNSQSANIVSNFSTELELDNITDGGFTNKYNIPDNVQNIMFIPTDYTNRYFGLIITGFYLPFYEDNQWQPFDVFLDNLSSATVAVDADTITYGAYSSVPLQLIEEEPNP